MDVVQRGHEPRASAERQGRRHQPDPGMGQATGCQKAPLGRRSEVRAKCCDRAQAENWPCDHIQQDADHEGANDRHGFRSTQRQIKDRGMGDGRAAPGPQ